MEENWRQIEAERKERMASATAEQVRLAQNVAEQQQKEERRLARRDLRTGHRTRVGTVATMRAARPGAQHMRAFPRESSAYTRVQGAKRRAAYPPRQ
jgi:hypothetical protein